MPLDKYMLRADVLYAVTTKSGRVTTDANGVYNVVFNTPFVNDDYSVALTVQDLADWSSKEAIIAYKSNRTANGFTIVTREAKKGCNPVGGITVSWLTTINYNPYPLP